MRPPRAILSAVLCLLAGTAVAQEWIPAKGGPPSTLADLTAARDVPNDPLFTNQWNLANNGAFGGTVGADLNATAWWDFAGGTRLGASINIAIVDDGVEHTHPDLSPNFKPDLSWNFQTGNANPMPPGTGTSHGTLVAGLAAGYGNNSLGLTGVAPRAGLSGIVVLRTPLSDGVEAQALTYQNNNQGGFGYNHIYSSSWGPTDDGMTLEGPGPLTKLALTNGVTTGRGGLGSIFVWSAGNGGLLLDNSNFDGYANARQVIAVGATANNGAAASYSEPGANVFVNAPGGSPARLLTTTDRAGSAGVNLAPGPAGDYYNGFSGTSAAAPQVAGAVALILEANPGLGWRDVKHILVRTSTKNDPGDPGWVTNAAGFSHNEKYGFGRLDIAAAASMAQTWTNVGPETVVTAAKTVGTTIADGTGTTAAAPVYGAPVLSTISVTNNIFVEHIELTLNLAHSSRSDLEYALISPSGVTSILGTPRIDYSLPISTWQFMTVRNWGEFSTGDWTLRVRDGLALDTGTLNSWSMAIYGTPVPEPSTFALLAAAAVLLGLHARGKKGLLRRKDADATLPRDGHGLS